MSMTIVGCCKHFGFSNKDINKATRIEFSVHEALCGANEDRIRARVWFEDSVSAWSKTMPYDLTLYYDLVSVIKQWRIEGQTRTLGWYDMPFDLTLYYDLTST